MRYLITVLTAALLTACAVPTGESLRPRGVDVWASGGSSNYEDRFSGRGRSDQWEVGVNVHFDITYADEWEVTPRQAQ